MGKFKELIQNENNFKLVSEFDGKPVRLLMDNDKSFKLIDPKTGKTLNILMDDKYSFKLVKNRSSIESSKDNKPKQVRITLKDGTSFRLMTGKQKNTKEDKTEEYFKDNYKSDFELFFTEKSFSLLEMIITLFLVVCGLIFIWSSFNEETKCNDSSLNGFESIKDKNLTEFIDLYTKISESYYKDIDQGEMLDVITESMLKYLGDNFTGYIEAAEAKNLMDKLNGTYEGLGFEVYTDDNGDNIVNHIFEDSPAAKSGIKKGDKVISLAGVDVTDKKSSEISLLIKEKLNGLITVVVERKGKRIEIPIQKGKVVIKAVTKEVFNKHTGYIKIDTFSNVAVAQVNEALKSLENDTLIDSLIIDVRFNNGGYLDSAAKIADLFIQKGKNIYQMKTNKGTTIYTAENAAKREYPIVVLINGSSASAAEVFALAMKGSYGATLIGSRSYGKGTVQETVTLSTGSLVKYTIANWYGPNGEDINKKGIDPDMFVDMGSAYIKDQTYENDGQLQRALKVVKQ